MIKSLCTSTLTSLFYHTFVKLFRILTHSTISIFRSMIISIITMSSISVTTVPSITWSRSRTTVFAWRGSAALVSVRSITLSYISFMFIMFVVAPGSLFARFFWRRTVSRNFSSLWTISTWTAFRARWSWIVLTPSTTSVSIICTCITIWIDAWTSATTATSFSDCWFTSCFH